MLNSIETAVDTFLRDNNVNFNPYYLSTAVDNNWKHFKWAATFAKVDPSRYYSGFPVVVAEESFCYRMGMVHSTKDKFGNIKPKPPRAASVLHSLLLDAGAERVGFESWCDEYGYDVDSRKALRAYVACQKTAVKLANIFTSSQLETLREMMQDY